jgi:hypothetical protein
VTKRNRAKPGYLGPAFYEWLKHLEAVEYVAKADPSQKDFRYRAIAAQKGYAFNDALFPEIKPGASADTVREMLPVDAWLAQRVRASTKYTVDLQTLTEARKRYSAEFDHILETMIVEAPFENVTVCFTNFGPDDIVVNVTKLDMHDTHDQADPSAYNYESLGLTKQDPLFYSASMVFHRTRGPLFNRDSYLDMGRNPDNLSPTKLSHCPVEIHFNAGRNVADTIFLNAIAAGVAPTQRGKDLVETVRVLLMNFFASFWLSSALRKRQVGRTPVVAAKMPRHAKKYDKPRFEHWVVQFELDKPDPEQSGVEREQPKKRRHQVRGFPRTYPEPIKSGPNKGKTVVWVTGHWRGDANLGIVRKDHEITLHKPSN